MKVLALDISTKCGWALLEGENGQAPKLLHHGLIQSEGPKHWVEKDGYPIGFYRCAAEHACKIARFALMKPLDFLVIEETNLGRDRYAQKLLEFLHCEFLKQVFDPANGFSGQVIYLSSSQWRHALGLQMSKQDKKNNAKLSKAKKLAAERGEKLDKAALGIKGKVSKKHLAIRYVNERFGLNFKVKDNDVADAICLGTAFFHGAVPCDGQ